MAARAIEHRKFNPDEPRIPGGGPGGGEWGHGGHGIAGDALKLAGRIDLADGETLVSSKKVRLDSGAAKIAVTDLHGRRSIRLGLGGDVFAEDPWRAAPKGATVKLTADQTTELATGLEAAAKKAKTEEAAANKLWDAADGAQGTPGHSAALKKAQDAVAGNVVQTGVVSGQWGDVHYGYRVHDSGYDMAAAVRPTGSPADWNLEDASSGAASADTAGVLLNPAELAALVRTLRNTLTTEAG